MKRLLSSTDEDFNNEVEALKLVRKLRHPHLVKLLGTFKYRDSYYLIFRWAVDDLKTFWQNSPFPNPDATRSTWTLQQCLGIAKGLQLIHRGRFLPGRSILRGRHGDIKPANILRYAPRAGSQDTELGVLKISDFGLTRFHHNHSHQREYTNGPLATRTYRAPEGDLKHTISDSWDLWSLGCLYLEFITWLLQGWDGVTTFSEERKREDQSHYWEVYEDKFFNLTKAKVFGACVKDSVTRVRYCLKSKCDGRLRLKQHIRALHNHPECTDLIHDFLDVISEDLIRIRCDERAKCYEVVRKLEAMKENVLEDEAYYTKGQGRFVTRGTYESDKSCNPTVGLSNPGHAYHHEGGYDDAGKSSKTPGLASESGGEDNSLVRIKNQHSKRRHLSGLLNFLKSCFQSGTRDLGGNANR
ncbi:kinase-like domain-containing protein [Nemania abortiva]|nr:kinase-like domain-containing protein [Nemania abortiva]